jgi:hypothetical protein
VPLVMYLDVTLVNIRSDVMSTKYCLGKNPVGQSIFALSCRREDVKMDCNKSG